MIKSIEGYSYKINEHIGKGYSSTVHKGKNQNTGEDVSIKVIEMTKLQDPINHMLLQFQVSALKSLAGSSNVLHLYDVYATKNNTYIITELMQGDLHNLLKQKKQFPYYEACQIIKQIITGYLDVFKNGYLHRDIKPANIFYKNGSYKIGDFGFAIPAKDCHQHRAYNVGSPVYMPPEALRENLYNYSCDTWAIGVIFYQLLKGIVPWRAISEPKLYEKIMNQPLFQLTMGLPQIARNFLSKLLHLDSSQRMAPQQLITWPNKLFSVQIRSMTPGPSRPIAQKSPLQQISLINVNIENLNSAYSRSKSYSSSQVPNYVSGLRINFKNHQNNTCQLGQNSVKLGQNIFLAPPVINNAISQINIQQNFQSAKLPQPQPQKFSQKSSTIFMPQQKKQLTVLQKLSILTSENIAINQMISYIKFIHKVIKFISHPTQVPLKDLELSLIRTLFKEIDRIKRFTEPQNLQFMNVPGWKQFVKTPQCKQKFTQKLMKLEKKYKMFHPLPTNEFILEVYKEQLADGIHKIYEYLNKTQKPSQKALISLDLLVYFYQVWSWKDKSHINKSSLVELLEVWRFDKFMEKDIYNVESGLLQQMNQKVRTLGIVGQQQDLTIKNIVGVRYPLQQQQTLKLR